MGTGYQKKLSPGGGGEGVFKTDMSGMYSIPKSQNIQHETFFPSCLPPKPTLLGRRAWFIWWSPVVSMSSAVCCAKFLIFDLSTWCTVQYLYVHTLQLHTLQRAYYYFFFERVWIDPIYMLKFDIFSSMNICKNKCIALLALDANAIVDSYKDVIDLV